MGAEMSKPTKKQRAFVAGMKWPPCPITPAKPDPVPPIVPDGVSISGGYVPTGLPPVEPRTFGNKLPFAEQHFDDRVILSTARHAELVRKINMAIDALKTLAEHPAFADDAPEFNEGGIGYETLKELRK